jgi:NMD protein affecting ribosome stability and mRNA decay
MSRICLHCGENDTTGTHRICDTCLDNAGDFLEANVERIQAFPWLLEACGLALDEIGQWVEVMGGPEDPRTRHALDALNKAIAKATAKAA